MKSGHEPFIRLNRTKENENYKEKVLGNIEFKVKSCNGQGLMPDHSELTRPDGSIDAIERSPI